MHSHSLFLKIAAVLLVILNAALPFTVATEFAPILAGFSLIVALVVLALTFTAPVAAPAVKPVVAEAVKPAPVVVPQNQAQAEILTLLGVFQEKGRFVDFLMEDVTPYNDAEVGLVARAVHQGCKAALDEHFHIEAISAEAEGAAITVPAGYPADEFRLVGNLSGQAPFSGKVVHRGWRTTSVKLPRVFNTGGHLPVIAPAQVEVQ